MSTRYIPQVRRLAALAALLCASGGPWANADGTGALDGLVALPAAVATRPTAYKTLPSGKVGEPDRPRAAVYLERADLPAATGTTGTTAVARLEQRDYQFRPGLLVVRTGTVVAFPNADAEYHSVFSYSRTEPFDLGRYRAGEDPPRVVFDTPGVVELNCEIHPHMRGFVLVVDTPYFTTTDETGRFRIDGLPPGTYRAKVWVNRKTVYDADLRIEAGATQTLNVSADGT
jgi:plastocyanin